MAKVTIWLQGNKRAKDTLVVYTYKDRKRQNDVTPMEKRLSDNGFVRVGTISGFTMGFGLEMESARSYFERKAQEL
jgi:hypothetical protein